jgi:hypothetical protein
VVSPRARRARLDRAAGWLASLGAALGVIAALVDLAAGASIRDWVGNKLDTTRLGAATLVLSAIALAAAIAWQAPGGRAGGRRLATVLALLVPAGVCFTTIGRLWYLPGPLLLAAAGVILAASSKDELAGAVTEHRWLRGLTVVLGGYYVFLGVVTLGLAGALGVGGGLAIWAALLAAASSQRLAVILLALGALPFAVATWWSLVTPLIALLTLVIGTVAVRQRRPRLRATGDP